MERKRRSTRIERRRLSSLRDFPDNPRQHSKKQLRKLATDISELGFIGVIVIDEDGFILVGHARREAAITAGINTVDCLVVDHLTQAQKRAFVLAYNRLGLDATWDVANVEVQIAAILADWIGGRRCACPVASRSTQRMVRENAD